MMAAMTRKPPSKATQKLRRNIHKALSDVEKNIVDIDGFVAFEHQQQWDNFPNSLRITVLMASKEQWQHLQDNGKDMLISNKLQQAFLKVGIKFRDMRKNICFSYANMNDDKSINNNEASS